MKDSKKMTWYTLAFIAFSGVWGFGNVLNGFVYFKWHSGNFQLDINVCALLCALYADGRRAWFCF